MNENVIDRLLQLEVAIQLIGYFIFQVTKGCTIKGSEHSFPVSDDMQHEFVSCHGTFLLQRITLYVTRRSVKVLLIRCAWFQEFMQLHQDLFNPALVVMHQDALHAEQRGNKLVQSLQASIFSLQLGGRNSETATGTASFCAIQSNTCCHPKPRTVFLEVKLNNTRDGGLPSTR